MSLFDRFRHPVLALALGGAVATAGGCAPAISTQQEVQLGRQNAAEINRQLPIVRDAAVNQYINQLGRSIARVADPRGIPYTFYVVNSNVVNAFAVPGGHIYVNRGLIERADNMSELAGVLAHEVAHVAERHGIEQWQRAQNANLGLSLLYGVLLGRSPGAVERVGVQAAGGAVFASYGRDAEREADLRGVDYMVRAGYNPQGMVRFFNELLSERKRNPSRLEQWFSTHPLTEERIQNTSRAVEAIPAATRARLATDTRAYQSFRARVRSLPAARQ
ncbi:MAG TPA: M48 family metallopeptidase [Longimicrobiaceae bacterium]|nr:M48 family metallopeptidase [Longimicrobiaceae bacterium]